MEVRVDPRCALPYYTMVLQGLTDLGIPYRFSRLDGPQGHGMAMRADGKNIWFAANDMAWLEPEAVRWAHLVAKVNMDPDGDHAGHVRPVGPMFGVRAWRLPWGYRMLHPLVRAGAAPRQALAQLRFQGLTRLPIDVYEPSTSDPSFVFLRARDWRGRHEGVNEDRRRFVEAVEPLGLDCAMAITEDRVSLQEYLDALRRSVVAFNAPAVHACLGWKLGEYLALGKAIVSTPLGRLLPEPLVHGEHVHFVDRDTGSIRAAVQRIAGDDTYRQHLESGARAWYERNLQPAALVGGVLGH